MAVGILLRMLREVNPNIQVKEVDGFPGHAIDTDARVWVMRSGEWREVKQTVTPEGYLIITAKNVVGEYKNARVHVLMLTAFVGPRPPGMYACHYPDHDKQNNSLENLRWDTPRENAIDNYRHLLGRKTKKCTRCGMEKPLSEFGVLKRALEGRRPHCLSCGRALNQEDRRSGKYSRQTRAIHADRCPAPGKVYERNGLRREVVAVSGWPGTISWRRPGRLHVVHCESQKWNDWVATAMRLDAAAAYVGEGK